VARYDIHPAPDGRGYWLDVQADLLSSLNTRIVIPLIPRDVAPTPAGRLNPVFLIDGAEHVLTTQFLSAVMANTLPHPTASLADQSDRIMAALDTALIGF